MGPSRTEVPNDSLREKYLNFRQLLQLNTECLEITAALQEDLQYVSPRREVVEQPLEALFTKAGEIVATLQKLSGRDYEKLRVALERQRHEVDRYIATLQETRKPWLSAPLADIGTEHLPEAGGKAGYLGEIKRSLDLPVPDGYVLTTEAYKQFCGIPLWKSIRDAIRMINLDRLETLQTASENLRRMVMECPMPRVVEVAIVDRARNLPTGDYGLAVRSSAVGEGGEKTYAGQFLSLINVPASRVVDAYRQVIAGRFSERALSYRIANGLLEVDTAMAVLFLPVIPARAAGVMYTRDPANPKSKELWVTATHGLALDLANGRTPADLFIVSRKRTHHLLESYLVAKHEEIRLNPRGGIHRVARGQEQVSQASLNEEQLAKLAAYGLRIEEHFGAPQDIEWVFGEDGAVWIVQSRPLALVEAARPPAHGRPKGKPLLSGGRTIYPGRVSGPAHLARDVTALRNTPQEAILLVDRASPDVVPVLQRISGLVAEWGSVAGHSAALLREFKVPSVFLMKGALEKARDGDPVSLDAAQCRLYPGTLWEGRAIEIPDSDRISRIASDLISRNILMLHLLDPSAHNFRPAGCRSTHDVLRYCHEKAVEAMFTASDIDVEQSAQDVKQMKTETPLNLTVRDLGGGLAMEDSSRSYVVPSEIVSRPFQSLWKGITHPGVSWQRDMPASFSDFATLMTSSLTTQHSAVRALGQKSYLLVADQYMNLNSRLAYHFTLLDASVSDAAASNYISFRFAGGGATRYRRNFRACFIDACLTHYGFLVDRRGDLVNAWFKKAPAADTEERLDILGRLMACTSQLDMYMTSHEVMRWYVEQFLAGNYAFRTATGENGAGPGQSHPG